MEWPVQVLLKEDLKGPLGKSTEDMFHNALSGIGREDIRGHFVTEGHQTLAVVDGDEVIAAANIVIFYDGDVCEVVLIAVSRKRQGLAKLLMNHIKREAASWGVNYIVLKGSNTDEANAFFTGSGFSYHDPERHLSIAYLERRLAQFDPKSCKLMVCPLFDDPQFVTAEMRDTSKKAKLKARVKVLFGVQKEVWARGTVVEVKGLRIKVKFDGRWDDEWLPMVSPRLRWGR